MSASSLHRESTDSLIDYPNVTGPLVRYFARWKCMSVTTFQSTRFHVQRSLLHKVTHNVYKDLDVRDLYSRDRNVRHTSFLWVLVIDLITYSHYRLLSTESSVLVFKYLCCQVG